MHEKMKQKPIELATERQIKKLKERSDNNPIQKAMTVRPNIIQGCEQFLCWHRVWPVQCVHLEQFVGKHSLRTLVAGGNLLVEDSLHIIPHGTINECAKNL
jgi:hypothetical protein